MNKKRISANELIPGNVHHPGEFIKDEIRVRGMKQQELAEALELSKTEVSLIINGKRNVTVAIAVQLEKIFGMDAEVWMNLQARYEIGLQRIAEKKLLESSKKRTTKKSKSNRTKVTL